jgi:hypothetical protein
VTISSFISALGMVSCQTKVEGRASNKAITVLASHRATKVGSSLQDHFLMCEGPRRGEAPSAAVPPRAWCGRRSGTSGCGWEYGGDRTSGPVGSAGSTASACSCERSRRTSVVPRSCSLASWSARASCSSSCFKAVTYPSLSEGWAIPRLASILRRQLTKVVAFWARPS